MELGDGNSYRDRAIVTPVDPRLPVESRASPPGGTGETPVPPSYNSPRGHDTSSGLLPPGRTVCLVGRSISLPVWRPRFCRLLNRTVRGALDLTVGIHGLHRNHLVGSRLFVSVDHLQEQTVLLNFVFPFMADGQKRCMLQIHGTNVVLHFVGSEQILGT